MRRASLLLDVRQDIAYAFRTLRLHAGFTVVTVLVLALGIGANTALFTLVNALMLRTLPVPQPARLIAIGDPTATGSVYRGTPRMDMASYPVYVDVRDGARGTADVLASARTPRLDAVVDAGKGGQSATGEAEHPTGRFVSGNYFAVLRVPAALGRTFTAAEDVVPGSDPVIVISQSYWQHRLGGDRSAVGRTIALNGTPFTVIGVAPAGFTGDVVERPTDIWIPLMMQPSIMPHRGWLDDRSTSWLQLMGRLAPGVSAARAGAIISGIERRSILDHPLPGQGDPGRDLPTSVQITAGGRGFSAYRSIYAESLYTLMAAVVLVLLVVCANVANLMLARATARSREIGVRMALGAARVRLVRQLLTESLLLAILGGACGLLVALWGTRALLHLAGTGGTPVPLDAHLDGSLLAFTAALSLVTATIFGLFPALRATRLDLATALRAPGRAIAGTPGRVPVGKLLVLGQIALSLLLLVGTGMLVRSMQHLEHSDVGVDRDRLVIASIDAQRAG